MALASPMRSLVLALVLRAAHATADESTRTPAPTSGRWAYAFVGDGWCRPSGCFVHAPACRTNGFIKDETSAVACKSLCDGLASCIGYAVSDAQYSFPNRCYVSTVGGGTPPPFSVPSAFQHYDIATSSGTRGVRCYQKLIEAAPARPPPAVVPQAPAASEAGACQDTPVGWEDKDGDGCDVYVDEEFCSSSGGLGPRWSPRFGSLSDFSFQGVSASEACCGCGGGAVIELDTASSLSPHQIQWCNRSSWYMDHPCKPEGTDVCCDFRCEHCGPEAFCLSRFGRQSGECSPRPQYQGPRLCRNYYQGCHEHRHPMFHAPSPHSWAAPTTTVAAAAWPRHRGHGGQVSRSTGDVSHPWCVWDADRTETDRALEECARALCRAAGFSQAELSSAAHGDLFANKSGHSIVIGHLGSSASSTGDRQVPWASSDGADARGLIRGRVTAECSEPVATEQLALLHFSAGVKVRRSGEPLGEPLGWAFASNSQAAAEPLEAQALHGMGPDECCEVVRNDDIFHNPLVEGRCHMGTVQVPLPLAAPCVPAAPASTHIDGYDYQADGAAADDAGADSGEDCSFVALRDAHAEGFADGVGAKYSRQDAEAKCIELGSSCAGIMCGPSHLCTLGTTLKRGIGPPRDARLQTHSKSCRTYALEQCKSICMAAEYCCSRMSGCNRASCHVGCEVAVTAVSMQSCLAECDAFEGKCSVTPLGFAQANQCTVCTHAYGGQCRNHCEPAGGCAHACEVMFAGEFGGHDAMLVSEESLAELDRLERFVNQTPKLQKLIKNAASLAYNKVHGWLPDFDEQGKVKQPVDRDAMHTKTKAALPKGSDNGISVVVLIVVIASVTSAVLCTGVAGGVLSSMIVNRSFARNPALRSRLLGDELREVEATRAREVQLRSAPSPAADVEASEGRPLT